MATHPDKVTPYPGAPRFFRRVWDPGPPGVREFEIKGRPAVRVTPSTPDGGLAIYGYSARSDYPEDHPREDGAWALNRTFPGWCFSAIELRGEWGFTPVDECEEITREEFELAQRRGFR